MNPRLPAAMKPRSVAAFAASVAAPVLLITAALTTRPLPAAENKPPAPPPAAMQWKTLYSEKCSACHNLPKPEEKAMTRAEWRRTVDRMLTKYRASESISAPEAAHIVDYLATFAPKNPAGASDPWGADRLDVWGIAPNATRVLNFEGAAPMAQTDPVAAGPGAKAIWLVAPDSNEPDGHSVWVSRAGGKAGSFTMLAARGTAGRDLDIRVRFRITGGKASPSVGVAFGMQDPTHYSLLRFDQTRGDLSLSRMDGSVHTTLQKTSLRAAPASPAAPNSPALAAAPVAAAPIVVSPNAWHTLRVSVKDGQVRGWIDMNKRISIQEDGYQGGKVALWSQGDTTASFDDWTIDIYDTAAPPAPAA